MGGGCNNERILRSDIDPQLSSGGKIIIPGSTMYLSMGVDFDNDLMNESFELQLDPDSDGNGITDIVLSNEAFSFILVSADLAKADKKALQKLDTLSLYCNQTSIKFYSLSSSTNSEIEQIKISQQLSLDFYFTDETTLKTMLYRLDREGG